MDVINKKDINQRLSCSPFYKSLFVTLLSMFTLISCGKKQKQHDKKPNIIFILADDMGYGDPGSYNPHSKIPTPNIDSLANQGMRFTDAHAAASWCVPSRYGLLTGQYPFRTKMNWKERSIINSNQLTIASLLKRRGYQTGMVGKWHQGFNNFAEWNKHSYDDPLQGGPVDHGFDYYYGIPASLDIPPYFYIKNDHAVQPPTDSIQASHSKGVTPIQGAFWRAGKIAPGFKHAEVLPQLTQQALSFINRKGNSKNNQPFFLYVALTAPHTPWLPAKEFKGNSNAGRYGDFVVQVDNVIGRIMKQVKLAGISQNTIFIFTSDNGPVWFQRDVTQYDHHSTAIFRGMKLDTWEGGHRVPFIVRWPGKIKSGSKSDALIDFTDMMATFAAVSGDTLTSAEYTDSYNLLPVWKGEKAAVRNVLPLQNTIRQGDWKLIENSGIGILHKRYGYFKGQDTAQAKLYNLADDPSESQNKYETKPDKVKNLKKLKKKFEDR